MIGRRRHDAVLPRGQAVGKLSGATEGELQPIIILLVGCSRQDISDPGTDLYFICRTICLAPRAFLARADRQPLEMKAWPQTARRVAERYASGHPTQFSRQANFSLEQRAKPQDNVRSRIYFPRRDARLATEFGLQSRSGQGYKVV